MTLRSSNTANPPDDNSIVIAELFFYRSADLASSAWCGVIRWHRARLLRLLLHRVRRRQQIGDVVKALGFTFVAHHTTPLSAISVSVASDAASSIHLSPNP